MAMQPPVAGPEHGGRHERPREVPADADATRGSRRAGASSVISLISPKMMSFTCTGMFVRLNIEIHCPAAPSISSARPTVNGVVMTNSPTRNTDAYARRVVNDAVSSASVVAYAAIASPASEEARHVEPVRLQVVERLRVAHRQPEEQDDLRQPARPPSSP